jgi:hypothetical protein
MFLTRHYTTLFMHGLPSQLNGQAIEAIRRNLRAAIELRDEIKDLKPIQRRRLSDYVSQAYDRVTAVYHGERDRFYVPHAHATMKLGDLQSLDANALSTQFSTHKTKLVSSLNQYIKGLQRGLQEHDLEEKSTPPA